ncbi:MAG: dihydrolipoyl dehydrogenase [Phycisphaerae bacterium]|nr:dihydrolipoyl dehydrogenase [Phycisphaerae bacterium]
MTEHYQIAVIGTGPGGYIAALKAAQMGAKTAVVEKHHLGGTCLNYGCIPSKALLASAELMHRIQGANGLGVSINGNVSFDWTSIQKRKDKVLTKLRGGIKGLFGARNVTLYTGTAMLDGAGKVNVTNDKGETESFTADKIILATGSIPARIPGWPTDPNLVCTSDEALHWNELPKRLLIVGGGVIGVEFACMMHEYGVEVTVVELMDSLLPEMEPKLGQALAGVFTKRGIKIHTGVKVENLETKNGGVEATLSGGQTVQADKVLVATGRRPNTKDMGLESIGLETDRGFIRVNNKMETAVENYYCIGDANGRCLLAHAASAQGEVAVKNALGKDAEQTQPVPNAVYTFPEIASVGLTTKQAQQQDIPIRVGEFPIGHLGKAMAVGEEFGFVRVIRHFEDERLLGVHIIGHNATEIIESATAMLLLKASTVDLAEMIFAHPTLSESVKEAAEDSFQHALHLPPRKITRITVDTEEVK